MIVDDQQIIREGLTEKIKKLYSDAEIVQCASCEECEKIIDLFLPDIVFMDISMPEVNGISCTKRLLSVDGRYKVLAFSMNDNDEMLNKMLKAGARGYLLKTDSVQDTRTAIEEVLNGDIFISKNIKR